jgi:hypothetical protein
MHSRRHVRYTSGLDQQVGLSLPTLSPRLGIIASKRVGLAHLVRSRGRIETVAVVAVTSWKGGRIREGANLP